MGDIYLAEQSYPSTPAAGNGILWADATSPQLYSKDDAGRVWGKSHNASIANQGAGFATDTYVTDSDILIPSFGLQARSIFRWVLYVSKTAAGVATPIYSFRIGSARTTADTARVQLTGTAQTAAVDIGVLELLLVVRIVAGGTGAIRASSSWKHNGAATGFAADNAGAIGATSASFDDSALGGQYVGISIDGGAAAAWTVSQVLAEATW